MSDFNSAVVPLRLTDAASLLAYRLDPWDLQELATELAQSVGAFLKNRDPRLLALIREQARGVAYQAQCIDEAAAEETHRIRRAPINAAARRRKGKPG